MSIHSLRDRLASELPELLASADGDEAARLGRLEHRVETEYRVLFDTDERLHDIYHFLADADIRERDSGYRAWQQRRIVEIVEHLEGLNSSRGA